jgi:ubiquinone/menaquinone biosynthesis C-methylase UbiE
MNSHQATLFLITVIGAVILISFGWRWASRIWSLPCPSLIGWVLESPFYGRIIGTQKTLERIGLQPGQRVLEIGPGPGRLLIPVARKVLPGGTVVGIDIQARMLDRLKVRAKAANITNLTTILGDATQTIVPEASFDVVYLAAALGEIPDRAAALAQCFRALKAGGLLSITETQPDPHHQSRATVKRLAAEAGFQLKSIQGGMWLYTANFVRP